MLVKAKDILRLQGRRHAAETEEQREARLQGMCTKMHAAKTEEQRLQGMRTSHWQSDLLYSEDRQGNAYQSTF